MTTPIIDPSAGGFGTIPTSQKTTWPLVPLIAIGLLAWLPCTYQSSSRKPQRDARPATTFGRRVLRRTGSVDPARPGRDARECHRGVREAAERHHDIVDVAAERTEAAPATHPPNQQPPAGPGPPEQGGPPTARPSTGWAIIAVLLILTVVVIVAVALGAGDKKDKPAAPPTTVSVPAYEVMSAELNSRTGAVELLLAGATVDTAQAVIRDYAESIPVGVKDVSILVVRSPDAGPFVCRGRWIADEAAASLYTGNDVRSSTWPAIDMDCPTPAGR